MPTDIGSQLVHTDESWHIRVEVTKRVEVKGGGGGRRWVVSFPGSPNSNNGRA